MSASRPNPIRPTGTLTRSRATPPSSGAGIVALVVAVLLAVSTTSVLAAEPTGATTSDPSRTAGASPTGTQGVGVGRSVTIGLGPATGVAASPTILPATPTPTPTPTPVPTPTPAPTPGTTVLGESVTFFGRGWGHGVGLSQHGARGRAIAGQTAEEILAHYYQGVTFGSMDPATPIRVLLMSGWTASASIPLTIFGRWADWSIEGVAGSFPPEAKLAIAPAGDAASPAWRMVVTSPEGVVLHDGPAASPVLVHAPVAGVLKLWSKPSAYDTYRGSLAVLLSSTGPTLAVVNHLPIDEYLRGVVPVEMPPTYPVEALRAQAVAARSYAAYRLRPGVGNYDLTDDTRSQVYRGVLGEKTVTDAVIAQAPGAVMYSGSAYANALFHSTGGGATEHNENAFVSSTGARVAAPVSYLRGSLDRAPDGSAWDAGSPYATWQTATYAVAQLSQWFASDSRTNVGTLLELDLRSRGVSGRLIKVTLIGTAGTKTVSGDVFRQVFNANRPSGDPMIRSTLYDVRPIP